MTDEPRGISHEVNIVLSRSALLTGLCLFVPVPFLDDYLAGKVRQKMASDLLRYHKREFPIASVPELHRGESRSCLWGCLGLIPALLLVPIKKLFKTLFFFLAIRDAALAVASTLFMGRCVHRQLESGALANGQGSTERKAEALLIFEAYEKAFKGSDWHALKEAFKAVLKRSGKLKTLGTSAVRRLFGKDAQNDEVAALPEAERAEVEEAVDEVVDVVESDEIRRLLESLDGRFDKAYNELNEAYVC